MFHDEEGPEDSVEVDAPGIDQPPATVSSVQTKEEEVEEEERRHEGVKGVCFSVLRLHTFGMQACGMVVYSNAAKSGVVPPVELQGVIERFEDGMRALRSVQVNSIYTFMLHNFTETFASGADSDFALVFATPDCVLAVLPAINSLLNRYRDILRSSGMPMELLDAGISDLRYARSLLGRMLPALDVSPVSKLVADFVRDKQADEEVIDWVRFIGLAPAEGDTGTVVDDTGTLVSGSPSSELLATDHLFDYTSEGTETMSASAYSGRGSLSFDGWHSSYLQTFHDVLPMESIAARIGSQ